MNVAIVKPLSNNMNLLALLGDRDCRYLEVGNIVSLLESSFIY